MNKVLSVVIGLALTVAIALTSTGSRAQTPQGDILRGRGRFLEGAGWYNLNTARADSINVETWKSYNREVQRLYRDYMVERYHRVLYKKGLSNKLQQDAERKFQEAQSRWRTNPTVDDIMSGAALNALAGDLADPSIAPSSWRRARVDLPPEVTLTTLAFKVADTKKSALSQSTIAVDRMLVKDGWPLAFRRPEIEGECRSYQKAVTQVVEKCRKGTELQAKDYDDLRATVTELAARVETAIPALDNQRSQSRGFVKRLDASTKIFAEQSYAEQLIRDVSEHKATTVSELLGFMRQYRLLFSDPGDSPEVTTVYEQVYGLLRRQVDMLGLGGASAAAVADRLQPGSLWRGTLTFKDDNSEKRATKKASAKKASTKKAAGKKGEAPQYQLTIKSRKGNRFSGESLFVGRFARKVDGTVSNGRINYRETDDEGHSFSMDGTIDGGEIDFEFQGTGARGAARSGEGRLKCQ